VSFSPVLSTEILAANDKVEVEVFVARHAIFDRNLSLFGYELLFRSCQRNSCDETDDTASTLQVLANSLLSSGLDAISCNAPVFINFGQELLTSEWTSLFPPKSLVIEILESVKPDPEVIASCLNLKKLGYVLALDDVVGNTQPNAELIDVANFVKVDFRCTSKAEQAELARTLKDSGKRLLAEKVETHEEFQWACEAGYDYFQGFFFARPTLLKGHHIPNMKVNALRLLRELQRPDLDFFRLEGLIKLDISLTYKLFRYVNSALFARSSQVASIKEALIVLGELDARRWITLATLPGLAVGTTRELIVHALVRARFCEMIAAAARLSEPSDAFLVGMFSLLDALVDRPLPEVLLELNLPTPISNALLNVGANTGIAAVFQTALAYEAGNWAALDGLVQQLALRGQVISDLYLEAIRWSGEMFNLVGPESSTRVGYSQQIRSGGVAHGLLSMEKAIGTKQTVTPVRAAERKIERPVTIR
jgi:c-di-GMP-related signal transduction protein